MTSTVLSGRLPTAVARLSPRWLPSLRTALVVTACLLSSTLAVRTGQARHSIAAGLPVTESLTGRSLLLWFVGLGVAVAMVWRHRWPVGLALGTAALTLVLPLDSLAALVATTIVVIRHRGREVWVVVAATSAATFASVWRDSRGTSSADSFWRLVLAEPGMGGAGEPFGWWLPVVIAAAVVAGTVGIALLRRSRADFQLARDAEVAARDEASALSAQVARQAERERIAREVHDALGHRLSLLSLHAGALEVAAAGDDPRVRASAALVRQSAQQSMADLRSLLTVLRTPADSNIAEAVPDLRDVQALVDENLRVGIPTVSTVSFDSVADLDPATGRAAYRVLQELLTNARRHAPGIPVRALVTAAPQHGVDIEVANHVSQDAGTVVALGSGLTGVAERAGQLGGEARFWVDEGRVFRAAILLPWVWAAADDGGRRRG
ncbi:MAG TPA: histidine kinase [Candidatus Lustribacter sp.]|nr:histidine kinase [Candidatus Lustribacter sp.]